VVGLHAADEGGAHFGGQQRVFAGVFEVAAVLRLAREYPDVQFFHCGGAYRDGADPKNVGIYFGFIDEVEFLAGMAAGLTTRTGRMGFVAAKPIPQVLRNINSFTLGARSVNPAVKVKVIWVDTWYDPGKERQAAETLIAQGADVLGQNTDSPAIVQTAEKKGVYAFGWDSDMSKYGPHAQLTANTENWGVYYIDEVRKVLNNTWAGNRQTKWGIKENMVAFSPLSKAIPAEVAKLFEDRRQAIAAGKLEPFAGPIQDNTGKPRVAAGAALPVNDILSITWYVEGIEGSVPK